MSDVNIGEQVTIFPMSEILEDDPGDDHDDEAVAPEGEEVPAISEDDVEDVDPHDDDDDE